MHKRLESELISLAHSILQMKNKDDVFALLKKSGEIHEKLSVLAFVEEYLQSTPNAKESKEEILEKVVAGFEAKETVEEAPKPVEQEVEAVIEEKELEVVEIQEEKVVYNLEEEEEKTEVKEEVKAIEEEPKEMEVEEVLEQPFDELEQIIFEEPQPEMSFKNDVKDVGEQKTLSLDEELKDTVSVDITANLFDTPQSLNDKLSKNIQIGLNDRIAFVKNLFENSQEDYNRVISQLNSFNSQKEAKKFIAKNVKPDYDWSTQEELETRFMDFIERKFA
ncbi:MAG: hypothetical protein CMB99_03725 [Flavobacteriaceae bacterium]|nr:hypothetical protein [Flavobacteriaceae bacterium]|tara:strand:- start:109243 stop:110076 length:834 start_codon:yes stop_codon:yes gene_type:complete